MPNDPPPDAADGKYRFVHALRQDGHVVGMLRGWRQRREAERLRAACGAAAGFAVLLDQVKLPILSVFKVE